MHLALTEILECPVCGSALVLLAERQEAGRAIDGALGCPSCDARYPVRAGVADLRPRDREAAAPNGQARPRPGEAADRPPGDAPPGAAAPGTSEDAIRVAALLGLEGARGVVVLAGSQARLAGFVGALVAGVEVAAVWEEEALPAPVGGPVSALLAGGRLPFADRRVAGVALDADGHVPLAEAVRVLAPGRRLLLERAGADAAVRLESLGCVVLARREVVVVAERAGQPEPPRLYQLA